MTELFMDSAPAGLLRRDPHQLRPFARLLSPLRTVQKGKGQEMRAGYMQFWCLRGRVVMMSLGR